MADLKPTPELESSELIALIEALQEVSGERAFELRGIVAHQLGSIVTSLTIAA